MFLLIKSKTPANTSFTGTQGAIGYNPTWNAGTAYQAWPSQPQSTDTSMF